MPKVRFATDIQSISGKLCSKEGVIYSVNKRTGETYRSDRHVINNPNTEGQQAVRATFKKKAQFASAWWKQNRPSSTSANGTDAYVAVMKAYKAQHKIGNPYSFVRLAGFKPLPRRYRRVSDRHHRLQWWSHRASRRL